MKQKKIIMIVLSVIFVFCIVLYFLSSSGEKETKKHDKFIVEEKNNSSEKNTDWEESPFKYDSVHFRYHTEQGMIDMEALLDQNEQRHVLEYKLYNFLFNKGYKEIEAIDIYGGQKTDAEFVEFTAAASAKTEEEALELKIVYNTGLYTFGIYFVNDKYNALPVSIRDMDYEVEQILNDKLKILEKEFGIFVFHEKLEAKTASITHYDIENNILSLQVELDDEYQTYCRIYYDMGKEKFDFKKW